MIVLFEVSDWNFATRHFPLRYCWILPQCCAASKFRLDLCKNLRQQNNTCNYWSNANILSNAITPWQTEAWRSQMWNERKFSCKLKAKLKHQWLSQETAARGTARLNDLVLSIQAEALIGEKVAGEVSHAVGSRRNATFTARSYLLFHLESTNWLLGKCQYFLEGKLLHLLWAKGCFYWDYIWNRCSSAALYASAFMSVFWRTQPADFFPSIIIIIISALLQKSWNSFFNCVFTVIHLINPQQMTLYCHLLV